MLESREKRKENIIIPHEPIALHNIHDLLLIGLHAKLNGIQTLKLHPIHHRTPHLPTQINPPTINRPLPRQPPISRVPTLTILIVPKRVQANNRIHVDEHDGGKEDLADALEGVHQLGGG